MACCIDMRRERPLGRSEGPIYQLLDPDLRFVEARTPALRTLPRLGELPFTEREATLPAFRGLDHHLMSGSPRGANRVVYVILDIGAAEAHLARD